LARPPKITEEGRFRFCGLLEQGNHPEVACRAINIGESTYFRYMQRGRVEDSGVYHDFRLAVEAALAAAEVRAVSAIHSASLDDWRAAMAFLERRFPDRWQKRQTTELTGKDGGPIKTEAEVQLDLKHLSDEELRVLVELYARASGHGPSGD
jgi:transposase